MKKAMLLLCLFSLLMVGMVSAQTTSDEPTSSVFFFFAACENQAVIDLNGTMEAGYDVYVQVFDQLGGQGNPLSNLLRVSVSGDYQVSVTVPFSEGRTLLLGQFASAEIRIARENNAETTQYVDTIDDVQDGCITPAYPSTDTSDSGSGSSVSTPLVDPITGEVITTGEVVSSSGIFTPDGGILNEVFRFPQEAVVQIGARPSDVQQTRIAGRTSDPGLIFAECDAFPMANPGRVFDTDTLVVFWSWFASSPALVQDHINHAQYEVFLTSDYAFRQPFPNVDVSEIVEREDGNYYVFYVANLGTGFRPGDYVVDFYLTWDTAISDGYDDFGPNTNNPFFINTCSFDVELNPFGVRTPLNNPTIPLQR